MPSGPKAELHLHVVLTEECENGDHLVANVSSIKPGYHDPTCCFAGGEHERITKPSFIYYGLATRISARHIKNMIGKKYYIEDLPVSDEVCDLICQGIIASKHTPRGIKKYYSENC